MPLEWPMQSLSAEKLDSLLDRGYRRSGPFLYRTRCPACSACEPTRIDIREFSPTRSMRRVLNRGDRDLQIRIAAPSVDTDRIDLFNRHRLERSLSREQGVVDESDYSGFLVDTICNTREISYWLDDQLVGIATSDIGRESISLVYCYFDPAASGYSVGTYSILKHIEFARQWQMRYVYLGMYVSSNSHLNYKGRFLPQYRFQQGSWKKVTSQN